MKDLKWIQSLQVGDVVCDCRGKHLKISEVEEVYLDHHPQWIRNIVFHDRMPLVLSDILFNLANWCIKKKTYLYDKDLTLEDGAHCSARHCCEPADHSDHA